jgi:hypothetical protein
MDERKEMERRGGGRHEEDVTVLALRKKERKGGVGVGVRVHAWV